MKHRYFISGNSSFLKETIEIIHEDLSPALTSSGWEESELPFTNIPALKVRKKLTASASCVIVLTFGTWFGLKLADKLFDSIYDHTLKVAVDRAVKKVFDRVRKYRKDPIEYQSLVFIEELNVSIVVRVIIKNDEDLNNISEKINEIHRIAGEKIKKSGKLAEIHCYTMTDGFCNIEPELFSDINLIKPTYLLTRRDCVKIEAIQSLNRSKK